MGTSILRLSKGWGSTFKSVHTYGYIIHRKKKMFIEVEREMAKYDIIAGKIADDATNATLTAYLAGAFGTAGDKVADDFCIRQLLPNKLKDQYCFKTEAAIECLKFVKGEKIWLK